MKVVVIEDEPLAADQLSDFIRRYDPEVTIVGVLTSVKEAVGWFRQHPAPDLVLSDIELLDGNAFRIFEQVQVPCPIIFTTAYDHFLLQAFDQNGIGYLLKPLEYEKFVSAMQKFEQLRRSFMLLTSELLHDLKTTLAEPKIKSGSSSKREAASTCWRPAVWPTFKCRMTSRSHTMTGALVTRSTRA